MKPAPQAPKSQLDRVVEGFFGPSFWPISATRLGERSWEPPLDFSETDKEYVVRMEIPGTKRDDLDVQVDGNVVTLSGHRSLNKQEKGEDYLWEERIEGRFSRSLALPGTVQQDKVEASYGDGVLTVRLPKAQLPVKNRILIR